MKPALHLVLKLLSSWEPLDTSLHLPRASVSSSGPPEGGFWLPKRGPWSTQRGGWARQPPWCSQPAVPAALPVGTVHVHYSSIRAETYVALGRCQALPLVLQGRSFMPSSLQPYHTGPCVLAPRHEETEAQKGMGTCLGSHTSQWKHPDSNRGHPAPGSAFSTRVSQELTVTDTHVHTHTHMHTPSPRC